MNEWRRRHLLVDVVERFVADFAADGRVQIVAVGQSGAAEVAL
jgi:hypothetical protein